MAHVRVWKFQPPSDCVERFAEAYDGDGSWAKLFARTPGFLGTQLLRPAEDGGGWLTIDRWDHAVAFEAFQRDHGADYRALDLELEGVAGEEEFVGIFED